MKCQLHTNEKGSVTIAITALLSTLVILFAANIDTFQTSKKYIYQNQQREALLKLSNITTVILSNEVACKTFLNNNALMNLDWNTFDKKEVNPKFHDNSGNVGASIAETIFVSNELKYNPQFKLTNPQSHGTKTVLIYLTPFYSNIEFIRLNTSQYEIPLFLEINSTQQVVGCKATTRSTFDTSSPTIEDYVCKTFNNGLPNYLFSFGTRSCEQI